MLSEKIRMLKKINNTFVPLFLRLGNEADKQQFNDLLAKNNISVYDEIYGQLKVLIKIKNPQKKFTDQEYELKIKEHIAGKSLEEYGVWVYYPWSEKLVHLLDEEEFVEVRTSANRNKITIEERNILATKKVGVIGLSVGQSVSVIMAMERGCGELRLADFDTIELNNLNRLRIGLHNLELPKVYAVAREIAEIDPFFKVVCYPEGVTAENINDFLTKGGNLDVVIDECDGIDIKLLCRIKAKELNIPVLMESSDRSTLDVERYDLEPNRSIMHGYLDHLPIDMEVLKNLKTNEEKLPYMLPLVGIETISSRMKASMIEIPYSITTWPQLATSVAMGGAITADTARRIFLDQFTDSGRYFIDLENLIRDVRPRRKGYEPDDSEPEPIAQEEMSFLAQAALKGLPASDFALDLQDVNELVNAAIKAPSAGNCQPWKWHYSGNYLFLFRDNNYFESFSDIDGMESFVAHGAALENIALLANKKGLSIDTTFFPLHDYKNLVAAIAFKKAESADNNLFDADALVECIPLRTTVRRAGTKTPLTVDDNRYLEDAVNSLPGASLIIKDKPEDIAELASILGACDRLKLLNPVTHFEFYKKMRWTRQESTYSEDGMNIEDMGLSEPEIIALKLVKKPEVIQLLTDWKAGKALEFSMAHKVMTSSAIGILAVPENTPGNSILLGKALQRLWLTATKHDISIQPLQDLIIPFLHISRGNKNIQSVNELALLHERFQKVFNTDSKCAYLLLRFNKGINTQQARSFRKPVEKVLFLSNS